MDFARTAEITFYVVETFALPFAIAIFVYEQRRERQNEEEELFQRLSDEYRDFLKLVLDNPDLQLLRREAGKTDWSEEQRERRLAIFGILVSLFENAFLVVYDDAVDPKGRRLWQSWEDYMREWLRRSDFREALPALLEGEDEAFTGYIRELARQEVARASAA